MSNGEFNNDVAGTRGVSGWDKVIVYPTLAVICQSAMAMARGRDRHQMWAGVVWTF